MANYTNSVEVRRFSYTPDTPPSNFLWIQQMIKRVRMRRIKEHTKGPKTALTHLAYSIIDAHFFSSDTFYASTC